jgi:hypothetical protein
VDGQWRDDLSALALPPCLEGLFRPLVGFRCDLSSTMLRAAGHTLPAA